MKEKSGKNEKMTTDNTRYCINGKQKVIAEDERRFTD